MQPIGTLVRVPGPPPQGTLVEDHHAPAGVDLDSLQTRALVPHRAPTPLSIHQVIQDLGRPEALDEARKLSELYDRACRALLSPNDVQKAKEDGREFKKKSAWLKLAKFFGISTTIVSREQWMELAPDGVTVHVVARVVVRAFSPWGQSMEAVALCSTREPKYSLSGPFCPKCSGPMWDNRRREQRDEDFRCKDRGCSGALLEGEYTWSDLQETRLNPRAAAKANNDVEATAQTRATNRAISNLVGAGEVSAEELDEEGVEGVEGAAPVAQDDAAAARGTGGARRSGGQAEGRGRQAAPSCPVCTKAMWDNRQENDERQKKGEKLRPDWKCKDRACDGVYWRGEWPKADPADRVRELADRIAELDPTNGENVKRFADSTIAEKDDAKMKKAVESLEKRLKRLEKERPQQQESPGYDEYRSGAAPPPGPGSGLDDDLPFEDAFEGMFHDR